MSETGKQEEQFKAGQVWLESSTGIMRTITEVLTDGRICYASCYPSADHANKRKLVGPQMECIQDWHDDYRLLTPETPDADRLTEQVAALTARVDALERPGETKPTPEPDVPRDCTGREVLRDQVVAYGETLFHVTGDSLIPVCILPNDGWNYGQEASFIAADWAECRILWPLAEGGEA